MLVCVYYCAFGTRDRGCSRHPAFPAPSGLRVRTKEFANLGRNHAARTRTYTLSPRRPGQASAASADPGPYAAADVVGKCWSTALLQQLPPVVMGPCFRTSE